MIAEEKTIETNEKAIREMVKVVMKEYDKEKKIEIRKNIYHNTYVLMKKYNTLKAHVENMSDKSELDYEMDGLGMEAIWVLSISKSKVKSIKMVRYIDNALAIVEDTFRKKGAIEEYIAFKMYFLDEEKNEDIAKKLGCSKNMPKRWSDNVLKELSILLWGYEALWI